MKKNKSVPSLEGKPRHAGTQVRSGALQPFKVTLLPWTGVLLCEARGQTGCIEGPQVLVL